jgi:peptide/nickel transport system substrate-binding protein
VHGPSVPHLPSINLWYQDTIVVHQKRLEHVIPAPSGSFTFLESAQLAN